MMFQVFFAKKQNNAILMFLWNHSKKSAVEKHRIERFTADKKEIFNAEFKNKIKNSFQQDSVSRSSVDSLKKFILKTSPQTFTSHKNNKNNKSQKFSSLYTCSSFVFHSISFWNFWYSLHMLVSCEKLCKGVIVYIKYSHCLLNEQTTPRN